MNADFVYGLYFLFTVDSTAWVYFLEQNTQTNSSPVLSLPRAWFTYYSIWKTVD